MQKMMARSGSSHIFGAQRWAGLLIGGVAIGMLAGCGSSGSSTNTFLGPDVAIGNGSGHTYTVIDNAVPQAIGVQVTSGALSGVPDGAPPLFTTAFHLPLPVQNLTAFKDLTFYYTQGHPPYAQYGVPHYHIAFSLLSAADRLAIDPSVANGDAPVAPAEFPATFLDAGYVLPQLGTVYFDPLTPEFQNPPGPFTTEFDYAYFQGHNTTWNLTAQRAFLLSKPQVVDQPLKLPVQYRSSGYYPTKYSVTYDAGSDTYNFKLSGFVAR